MLLAMLCYCKLCSLTLAKTFAPSSIPLRIIKDRASKKIYIGAVSSVWSWFGIRTDCNGQIKEDYYYTVRGLTKRIEMEDKKIKYRIY